MLWMTTAWAGSVGLCADGERVRVACEVKGGKQLALCQVQDRLVYRFGKPGTLELELPAKGGVPIDVARESLGADHERVVASAWNEGHRYAVITERTEDQFDVSVQVRKGAGKPLATLACTKQLGIDVTALDGFVADPNRTESWIGQWSGGEASFSIVEEGGSLVLKDGEATWHGSNPGQIHTGEAAGPLVRVAPNVLKLTSEGDGCAITFTYERAGTIDATDNKRCGGMNVSFDWTYGRR